MLYDQQPALPPLLYLLAKVNNLLYPNQYIEKLAQTLIGKQAEAYDFTLAKKSCQKAKDDETRALLHVF